MATLSNITVKKELRLCKVNKELGYFHCWEQYADVIAPGLTVGSHPFGETYEYMKEAEDAYNDQT